MGIFNAAITRLFDLIFAPSALSPWLGMVVISLLTGFVLLLVFRYTSNQRGIRAAKNRIISHLLEVLLYRDELRVVLRAQARLLRDNLRYLGYALVPLIFMILPVLLLLIQADLRYGHRPLQVGEQAIVAVKLLPDGARPDEVSISAPAGLAVETPALRMPAAQEVDWRVRAVAPGRHQLRISVGEREFAKSIVVGGRGGRVSTRRIGVGLWQQLLHPGEPPLPGDGPVASIAVEHPRATLGFFRRRVHWIWPWLVLSMIFGYAFKGPLRIQV